ncbi:DUF1546-domain-containing protein [Gonapodya prolifera JEL478]|uniref:DUF1546-domain-containing protein n=1 Tax=Gonapodya prolifera (strain JEL478) TaxID=1344416 RepID=A0A139AE54_GONPJ|nr:DUF1546-domain-containing protein [Gonapodya prolifera JEL478]|eukprot:KXS15106.1 DUF1546-domain-containing protein [Gonapodya prolifera JEL478]
MTTELVRQASEAAGVVVRDPGAIQFLANDIDYRVREVIQEAHKFMRHSKRAKLDPSDINNALRVRNVEPLYGFGAPDEFSFGTAGPGVFHTNDEEINLDDLINAPLPTVPLDISITGHWLAIEGVQPAIPQNPTPHRDVGSRGYSTVKSESLSDDSAAKAIVSQVMSKELQLYFEKISGALYGKEPRLVDAAIDSVAGDPGINQLVPYLVELAAERVTKQLKSLNVLQSSMRLLRALLGNPHLFMEPHLHSMLPTILTCVVGKRLGDPASDSYSNHYDLRSSAATLAARICTKHTSANNSIPSRTVRTLLRAWLDPTKPFVTHFGGISGLGAMGKEAVRSMVLPNVQAYGALIEKGLKGDGGEMGSSLEAKRAMDMVVVRKKFARI